jgi:hypothetical protein
MSGHLEEQTEKDYKDITKEISEEMQITGDINTFQNN